MKRINVTSTPEFEKDKKSLAKKFKSIDKDLDTFITYGATLYHIDGLDSSAISEVPGFRNEKFKLFKVTKFACMSLKNRESKSGIRLIYAFYETEISLELVQMYFKADEINMDYARASEYLKTVLKI